MIRFDFRGMFKPKRKSMFEKCIKVVLKSEGGYVNHPKDPGGETKYGIAKRFFPNEDIKNLTIARARELYKKHYWDPMNLEGMNDESLVLHIFDFGVNAGRRRSIRMIQGIVGAVPIDGISGPITKGRINSFTPIEKVLDGRNQTFSALDLFKEGRMNYYKDLANRKPELSVFLKGWLNRIEHTKF